MRHIHTNFLNNYQQAIEHKDVDGLREMFIDRLGDLVAHHKPELIASLKRVGIPLSDATSHNEMAQYLSEVLHAQKPNKPVFDLLSTMMLTKENPEFNNDGVSDAAGGASATTAAPSSPSLNIGGTKLSGDQLSGIANSVGSALNGIFSFAKSAVDAKKAKKSTQDDLSKNITDKSTQKGGGGTPPPPPPSSNTGLFVGLAIFVVVLGIGGFIYWKKSQTSEGSGSAASSGVAGA